MDVKETFKAKKMASFSQEIPGEHRSLQANGSGRGRVTPGVLPRRPILGYEDEDGSWDDILFGCYMVLHCKMIQYCILLAIPEWHFCIKPFLCSNPLHATPYARYAGPSYPDALGILPIENLTKTLGPVDEVIFLQM